jgi:heat shock 70kDa protein 4
MPNVSLVECQGSQRCVVAASTGDVVLNELGGMTTATLVSFKGDERLVGEAAVLSSSTNPQNTIDSVNLWLGSGVAAIQQRSGRLPGARATFAAASDASAHAYGAGAVAVVEYLKGTQEFSTEQLLGMLLGKLTQQMRKKLRDDEAAHVNIAVPSGWGDAAHKALRVAARIAGIPSVSVVTRGAALARCFTRKHPVPTDGDAKHIVIMDMGHSTTSIAAVKLTRTWSLLTKTLFSVSSVWENLTGVC